MTREDIATERALKLHDLALSLVREKSRTSTSLWEYRHGLLDIEYQPDAGSSTCGSTAECYR